MNKLTVKQVACELKQHFWELDEDNREENNEAMGKDFCVRIVCINCGKQAWDLKDGTIRNWYHPDLELND